MNEKFLAVLHLLALFVALSSVVGFIVCTSRMLQEIKPSRHRIANLIPFLALALPGMLSGEGERYRAKAVIWLFAALISAAVGFAASPA